MVMVTTHFDPVLGPLAQISMALFLWDIFCVRNIALWGVQSITTERPAYPALLQHIWNHPVRENGRKQVKKSLFGPQNILLGAPEVLKGPWGARFSPNCHRLVKSMITSNHKVWPCIGPLLAQNAPFGGIASNPSDQIWLFYCIVWYCMLLNCIAWYSIALHGVVQFI